VRVSEGHGDDSIVDAKRISNPDPITRIEIGVSLSSR
jgi:hypothetical protein